MWGVHEDAVPFVDVVDALLIMSRVRQTGNGTGQANVNSKG